MIKPEEYQIRVESTEYLPVRVIAQKDGNAYNPTGDDVQIALPAINNDPITGDWKNGTWQTIGNEYFARILVGPANGDVVLERGDYDILVKITDSPEVPVIRAGRLTIV